MERRKAMGRIMTLAFLYCLLPAVAPLSDEGKALLAMKASFNNVANLLLNWNPSSVPDRDSNGTFGGGLDDHCAWQGVLCANPTPVVVSLNLSNRNLGREISPAVGELKSLQSLNLKGNRLMGQILDEIGDCVSLKYLGLSGNSLYGDIPFSLSKLKATISISNISP